MLPKSLLNLSLWILLKNEIKELLIIEKFKEEFSDAMHSFIDQNNEAEFKKFVEAHGATKATVSGY